MNGDRVVQLTGVQTESRLELAVSGRELARSGRGARIRRNAGVTMKELAEELGVTVQTLWRWENGKRTPRSEHAIAYALALRLLNEL
jgi:DNA-binding XRE family transcriptional regulator